MPRWTLVLALTGVWLLLWGDVTPTLVVGGLITAIAVLVLFPFPPAPWGLALRPWPTAVLLGKFAFDLARASVQVTWIVLRPRAVPRSAVLRVDLTTRSELLLTATAELVSLVPGTLLVELDPDRPALYLHVLDAGTPELIDKAIAAVLAQERRVVEAWAPAAERDAWREEVGA